MRSPHPADAYKETLPKLAVVGDSNGSFLAFRENIIATGLVGFDESQKKLIWIGGKNKLIIAGDVLADRGTDGFLIMEHIHDLILQAKASGGEIEFIHGNHERHAILALSSDRDTSIDAVRRCTAVNSQGQETGRGIIEIAKLAGIRLSGDRALNIPPNSAQALLQVLLSGDSLNLAREALITNTKAKGIIPVLSEGKIFSFHDGVLISHTDSVDKLIAGLLSEVRKQGSLPAAIAAINTFVQEGVQSILRTGEPHTRDFDKGFHPFVSTSHRAYNPHYGFEYLTEEQGQVLEQEGVHTIIHAHSSNLNTQGKGIHQVGNISIYSADHGLGSNPASIRDDIATRTRSVVLVYEDGRVVSGVPAPQSQAPAVTELQSHTHGIAAE